MPKPHVPTDDESAATTGGNDAFDAAFAEHNIEGPDDDDLSPPPPPADAGADAGADAAGDKDAGEEGEGAAADAEAGNDADGAAAGDKDAGEEGEGAAADADGGEPDPAAPPPPAAGDDVLARLADMLKPQEPAGEVVPAAQSQPEEPPLYSAEEQRILADYEKNWPDVARAEGLIRKAEHRDLLKYVFTSVVDYLKEPLAMVSAMQNTMHMSELKTAVPDYSDDLEEKVVSWIGEQPSYLQPVFKQVMQSGTSDEVADLIQRYRASTGAAPAAPKAQKPAAPPPPKKPQTELSGAAKQAAASLAPVSTSRSNVPQGEDPDDFNAAFSKYAGQMED